jgi:hypothetical protein
MAGDDGVQLQLHAVVSSGDLSKAMDHKSGYGASLAYIGQSKMPWDEDVSYRFRLGMNSWPRSYDRPAQGDSLRVNDALLSAEYLTWSKNRTFYLFLGFAANRWDVESSTSGLSSDIKTTKVAGLAGVGYRFKNGVHLEFDDVTGSMWNKSTATIFRGTIGVSF